MYCVNNSSINATGLPNAPAVAAHQVTAANDLIYLSLELTFV